MTNLTLDETRAIASLATINGYSVLIEKVVKSRVDEVIAKLKSTNGRDERADVSMEFLVWNDILTMLRRLPKEAVEELKTEGDSIYA